ncbi:MAG: DUF2283 domain-containing protein [Patescibacteria group bacterium]
MKITYDKVADAKYVYVKEGKISYTKEQQEDLLFDCDKKGNILGIEILNASKNGGLAEITKGAYELI